MTYAVTGVTGGGAASIDGTDLVFDTAGDFETLAAGETEEVTVEVTATDDSGAADTATITVTVTGENDAPVLEDQEVAVQEDGPVASIDLKTLASDVDDGVVLSYALVGDAPARGTVTLEDGVVAFDPSGDFEDLDDGETVQVEVGVEVSDGEGGVITRTVTFTVNGANDAPVLDDQALAASEDDGSASIDLGALATDVDGDALSYTYEAADGFVLPVPVAGNGTGVLTFDGFDTAPVQSLNAGETLEQVVNVTVSDGDVTDTATVTLTLTGENDVPTVAAGSGDAVEDGAGISVDLAALGDDVDDEDTGASLCPTRSPPSPVRDRPRSTAPASCSPPAATSRR
ncbi:Ig-like domain-containing protein (plasmid) [Roseivivax marinus]|uniref:Ig-like domain-containing protein n=1 Tax=Roseivivax marinus TaxID=1379903 RepID=UPI001F04B151|nr:Ig-like domain-containing protein [Roseivivax marinus]UMA66976.1 Ig-like domain-containing protein [Roseivivax marinus]